MSKVLFTILIQGKARVRKQQPAAVKVFRNRKTYCRKPKHAGRAMAEWQDC